MPVNQWGCDQLALALLPYGGALSVQQQYHHTFGVTITITGTLNNVGIGLWRPHHKENVCEVRAKNSGGTTVPATSY